MGATTIPWELDGGGDPVFIFHNESKGKNKMHVRKLDVNDRKRGWVMIDKTYMEQMELRKKLIDDALADYKNGDKNQDLFVTNSDKWCDEAKWELFDECIPYLLERFPYIFEKRGDAIYNKALDETVPLGRDKTLEDPLIRLSRLTQEDWCVMQEKEDGYALAAGVVCFPMRWSLKGKWNQVMGRIHVPVESFQKHLKNMVGQVMKNMKPEAPIWRANWAVFCDLKAPLDLWAPMSSDDKNDTLEEVIKYKGAQTGQDLVFRAEYQTLRKLPKSKCIIFSIRTYQRFLTDFKNHPRSDAQGLINAIEWMDEDNSAYKSAQLWKDAAITFLKREVMGQVWPSKATIGAAAATMTALVAVGASMWMQQVDEVATAA